MIERFIILSSEEAAEVRGPSSPSSVLEPLPLAGGAWALPASVLDAPVHAALHDRLRALPQRAVAPEEWPPVEE